MNLGHFGARKFWHNYLPRLKYHNPAVSMTVNRRIDQEGPATLTVFFAPPPSTTSASSSPDVLSSTIATNSSLSTHHPVEREESIDVKHIRDSEIYSLLMGLAKATPVAPTAEEEAELRQLKEDLEKSKQDSIIGAKYREKLKEEKALLDLARGAAPAWSFSYPRAQSL